MSTRKITKEQFSDRSTIDGSRIQKTIDEVVERTNDVPISDIARPRSVQTMILKAHTVNALGAVGNQDGFPWLYASSSSSVDTWRAKGVLAGRATTAVRTPAADYAGIWTSCTVFDRPVILDSVAVHVDGYSNFYNLINMVTSTPEKSVLQVLIDTDNTASPEDRTLNSKEFHLHGYDAKYSLVPLLSGKTAATADMLPPLPNSMTAGGGMTVPASNVWVLERNDLNIPIHQFARVRFRIAFADPDNVSATPEWGDVQGTKQPGHTTFVITYKETIHG